MCFLFSYLNPAHEQRAKAILSEHLGDLPISTSFEVLPKWKEYERASTTLADAYLKPVVSSQLWSMRERLDKAGVRAPSVVIKSNGGEMTLEAAARAPVNLAMSGPTGGVIASRYLAQLSGIDNLVTLDMGGTSTDVATILNQQEKLHHRLRDRMGPADPDPDARHSHHRRGRRLDRLDRHWRHVARRAAERRR